MHHICENSIYTVHEIEVLSLRRAEYVLSRHFTARLSVIREVLSLETQHGSTDFLVDRESVTRHVFSEGCKKIGYQEIAT